MSVWLSGLLSSSDASMGALSSFFLLPLLVFKRKREHACVYQYKENLGKNGQRGRARKVRSWVGIKSGLCRFGGAILIVEKCLLPHLRWWLYFVRQLTYMFLYIPFSIHLFVSRIVRQRTGLNKHTHTLPPLTIRAHFYIHDCR